MGSDSAAVCPGRAAGAGAQPATAACMKWGQQFGPEYVNRLYSGVRRNLNCTLRFVCLTDDPRGLHPGIEHYPIPAEPFAQAMQAALARASRQGAMRKVSLFRSGIIPGLEGPVLGFDLDVVITGALDEMFNFAPGNVVMREDWVERRKGRKVTGHGSVFRFDPKLHSWLYTSVASNPAGAVSRARGSEQRHTSWTAAAHGCLALYPDEWVASFKYDCLPPWPANFLVKPRLPLEARVVCFHGRPKMHEALTGYRRSLLRWSQPCDWLGEHWIGLGRADLGGVWA